MNATSSQPPATIDVMESYIIARSIDDDHPMLGRTHRFLKHLDKRAGAALLDAPKALLFQGGEPALQLCPTEARCSSYSLQIWNVTDQLEQCKQRLRDICLSHPKEALSLLSIPGIGLMTAASQIAFLCDGSRFESPDSYVNYAGLSERRFDSDNKVSKGHISHIGNKCIRRNIIQATWVASKTPKGNPLARKYDDLRLRGKSKPVAAVVVAKKMIQLSYILVKGNEIYEFTKQQGLAAFRRRLQCHKLAQLLDFLPEITKRQMEEIDRTKRKEAAATTSHPKKLA